jgi:hypothetical protein
MVCSKVDRIALEILAMQLLLLDRHNDVAIQAPDPLRPNLPTARAVLHQIRNQVVKSIDSKLLL